MRTNEDHLDELFQRVTARERRWPQDIERAVFSQFGLLTNVAALDNTSGPYPLHYPGFPTRIEAAFSIVGTATTLIDFYAAQWTVAGGPAFTTTHLGQLSLASGVRLAFKNEAQLLAVPFLDPLLKAYLYVVLTEAGAAAKTATCKIHMRAATVV